MRPDEGVFVSSGSLPDNNELETQSMAEEETTTTEQDPPASSDATENTEPQAQPEQAIPYSRFQQVNEARKQAEDQLAKLNAEKQEREQAEALARGEHEQVIEQLRQQLEQATTTAETNAAYKDALMASVQARIEAIPEAMRSMVPDYDDPVKLAAWLDKNTALLQAPPPPNTGAGAMGDKKPEPVKLTPEEQEMARLFGWSDERYATGKGMGAIPDHILQGKPKP